MPLGGLKASACTSVELAPCDIFRASGEPRPTGACRPREPVLRVGDLGDPTRSRLDCPPGDSIGGGGIGGPGSAVQRRNFQHTNVLARGEPPPVAPVRE